MAQNQKPIPAVQPWTKEFWKATKERKLLVQHCNDCGTNIFFPKKVCPDCWSKNIAWIESTGKAKIYTYTVMMDMVGPKFTGDLPFVLAMVDLEDGIRMTTRIVNCKPEDVCIDMEVEVVQKDIKNVHLSVYPPVGHVKVAAPESMEIETIRIYVISKLGWIKKQQEKLRTQVREAPRECVDGESHYFNGKRYLLKVVEREAPPQVSLSHSNIVLQVRHGANDVKKLSVLDEWYRQQLKVKVSSLVAQWEKKMDVSVAQVVIRKMKTKWGSCTAASRSIRINLELAKKPPECLEYIVVHELAHLIEPSHNNRFITLMDRFLPKWRMYRDELNDLPVRHEEWKY